MRHFTIDNPYPLPREAPNPPQSVRSINCRNGLTRGIHGNARSRPNPSSGTLAFQLGFLYYVRTGGRDLRRAAEMFERAARQPDAPPQAARFAAFARQNAGDLHVAYELWSRVAETSTNQYLREMAAREMDRITNALASGRLDQARNRLATPRVLIRSTDDTPASPPQR